MLEPDAEPSDDFDRRREYTPEIIRALPGTYALLLPDADCTVVEVSDSYVATTRTEREQILGSSLFSILPPGSDGAEQEGTRRFRASLQRAAATGIAEQMPLQRFLVPRPEGGVDARYWEPLNKPVFGSTGEILYLLHRIVDRTLQHTQGTQLQDATSLVRIAGRIAHIGGWSVDISTGQSEWSDEVCDIHGMPRGFSPTLDEGIRFYAPEHQERMAEVLRACAESGALFDEELEVISMDGRRVPVRVIGEAVRDAAGQIIRIQGALQDLTRIRSTEHALLRSQRRFQQFADAMLMIVWTSLPDGTLDFLSQSFYDYTGLHRAAVDLALGEWIAAVHPDDIESLVAAWPAAVAEGISYSLNFRIRRHDGGYRWHHTSARPVVEQDEVVRWIGSSIDVEDLLEAGQRAREVADELTSTLNSMSEGFCTLDDNWRITFVNPAAESLLRRDRDDLIGRIIWRIFPEVRGTIAYEAFTEAVRTGERQTFDLFVEPLNSWFEAAAYPSSGRLAVYFRDVTLARQAEAAIRLNEERFRAIARATSDVVWDWDLSTDFIWWNDGMHGLFGFEQDALESTSESWTNRIHPDDADRVISGIRDAMDSPGDEWSSEYRFLRADGTYAYVVDRGVVIRDKFGIAVRMVGGMTDLTTQREAQAEVRRQAALLEQARDAILVFGVDGRISAWNGSAARAYGVPAERAVGRPASELISTDQDAFQSAFESVLRDGEWQGRLTFQGVEAPPAREAIVECRWTLLRDEHGAPDAVLAIHSDITEQMALQRQLEQSQRLESLGQLTGGIAHDFNNLLTVVMGSSETLIDALAHDDRLRTTAEIMLTAAMRGAELTQRLLAFARRQPLDPEPHDLNRIVTTMEPLLRRTIGGSINVELSLAPDLSPTVVDSGQIESCILNLSINARDAMPQGGTLMIETANVDLDEAYAAQHSEVSPGSYVMLTVSDTGVGMSSDVRGRVFEPFFTTKPVGRGNGLGLSMVYGFVKQSGGHVKVYSEVGEGTTIKIYLPRASGRAVEAVVTPERSARGTTGEHVLVVEDDDLVRVHVADLLVGMGYEVTAVADGGAALDLLRTGVPVDLLFTDIVMPDMNGQELAEHAQALRPDVRVLFTSGYTENAVVHQGRIVPGAFLLSKPYTRGELEQKLRQALAGATGRDGRPSA